MKLVYIFALCLGLASSAEAGHFRDLVEPNVNSTGFLELQVIPHIVQQSQQTHFGNPSNGCEADEIAVRIQGVSGAVCSPKCDGMECPSDIPLGCEAVPQCMLQDAGSGSKYCALSCQQGTKCGPGASCQILFPGIGLCT
eukprot:CAMPEP_0184522950 /NCGR_PEP_ID=MMETSP0198_2-20121128/8590_1 /TAXON_ID=1112570 /ORGANISM="Thraustochytrium sp., Strain LLF1b" /LENGTH=139 /DNA_ID=CAMNT_0026913881 /DNA_START=248 /DNA_END=664 /DNA_ORIENTATION=+